MNNIQHTFAALGDQTRMAIIERLALNEISLSELAEPFAMSQTAVSKHVHVLSEAGLVEISKRGRTRYCRLKPEPLRAAEEWLETYQQFWSERFENLATFLTKEKSE